LSTLLLFVQPVRENFPGPNLHSDTTYEYDAKKEETASFAVSSGKAQIDWG